ncbi:MAG: phosphoglycerate dehydrogenase [Pirellulales bacterium]|nr:phosphoglycerate dehydrogenase [Pirellulales bacterium]
MPREAPPTICPLVSTPAHTLLKEVLSNMHRVIVLDNIAQKGLDLLEATPDIEYEVRTGLEGNELRDALADFDAAILRSGVKLTADALEGSRRLKAIARAGVGTDNIDKNAATRQGIIVMNTPAGNTLSTAEHTMALMLGLSRNVAPANQSLCEGRWDRKKYMGAQLAEKVLGVIGLGRIGVEVAQRAKAFGMRVLGYDPFLSPERAEELGIEYVPSISELVPEVDYLSVHTPLTDETRGMISHDQIERMKPSVRLINCARGGLYDEAALVDGLKSGKIGGVAVDVYEKEPCTNSPMFGMPNVLATPHLGASTEEAQEQVAVEGVNLLIDFLKTGAIKHSVNMTPLDPKTLAGLRGYLEVSYRLGLLLSQLDCHGAKSCELEYRGEVASKDTKLLTAAFAAGLLENALEEDVNIVNAELLLRERGVEISQSSRSDTGAFASVVSAKLVTTKDEYTASGTLFGNKMQRLVQLCGFRLESYLDGIMMIFEHQDVPGIIGSVGTIFGKHDVNIAQMSVGRASDAPGRESIGVLNLDAMPTDDAMDEVRGHPSISRATVIKLPAAGQRPAWLG